MSIVRKEGKDTIVFIAKEDLSKPCTIELPEPEPRPGLFLPNGEINWSCPCLGGMATGPCGLEFREAFTCFQKSDGEPKGTDCYENFKEMQMCMSNYPSLYNRESEMDMDEIENEDEQTDQGKKSVTEKDSESNNKKIKNVESSSKQIEVAKN